MRKQFVPGGLQFYPKPAVRDAGPYQCVIMLLFEEFRIPGKRAEQRGRI